MTIKNCHVHDFDTAFRLNQSDENDLRKNIAEDNLRNGFLFFQSDDNRVKRNISEDNFRAGFGIFDKRPDDVFGTDGSDNNRFVGNRADTNARGFHVVGISELNTFKENNGASNILEDATDDSAGGNKWVDNVFGTCSGFSDGPCPQP